ncbi:alpha/beta hydrolase [Sulfurovum indicum]|uniref:Alpha/beta hydrolase n=2 Tax=Sulfurovum TaxID=265570 RepID=A0A7M1S5S6_9BACT|nr:alpha/beta hydrolase [Sulfurovum indicum]QOR62686.1 alpha/beta hydrolase [Sulfurovum indicum]
MYLPLQNETIVLADGRILGFAQSGDPEGRAVFHFHGLHSSRLEAVVVHEIVKEAGIRFIGIDRPGIGLSSFQPGRTILDFPSDVEALADALGIEEFSLTAVSAGSPYLFACLHKLPRRVSSCAIIAGVPPVLELGVDKMPKESRIFISIAQKFPWLIHPLFWFHYGRLSRHDSDAERFLDHIIRTLERVDHLLLENRDTREVLLQTFRESYRQGSRGVACDGIAVFAKPWGFSLEEIDFRPVRLWHGGKDNGVPVQLAESVAERLKGAELTIYPDEGHLSIVFHHFQEIIHALQTDDHGFQR